MKLNRKNMAVMFLFVSVVLATTLYVGEGEDIERTQRTSSLGNLELDKQRYLEGLNELDQGIKLDLSDLYEGTTLDMECAGKKEYERWNQALNELEQVLQQGLSADERNEFIEQQRIWVMEREQKAKDKASRYDGGSMEGLEYSFTLAQLTKERCYELVSQYM